MERILNVIINSTLIVALVVMLSACEGGSDSALNKYDTDGDRLLSENEFETAFSENGKYYDNWDGNADGALDENEWRKGVSTYYSEYDYDEDGEFNSWDKNADGGVDDNEFTGSTFALWDENDDNYIDSDEYKDWNEGQ